MPRHLLLGWGSASEGQLGPSPSEIAATPRPLPLSNPSFFTAGLWTSLIITNAGKTIYRTAPSPQKSLSLLPGSTVPPGEPRLPSFTTAAVGRDFILLLTPSGDLYAIGDGAYGQLGHGSSVASLTYPSQITSLSAIRIVAVVAAEFHWLALDNVGRVFACGKNSAGELALPDCSRVDSPQVIRSLWPHPVVAIATGDVHSVVLTACGVVLSFGSNKHGQLGHSFSPVQVCSMSPVPVPLPDAVLRKLAAQHGDVDMPDMGADIDADDSYDQRDEVPTYADVACGSSHTVTLLSNGTLATWGKGENGQLGTRTAQNYYVPTSVTPSAYFVSVSAGHEHSAALTEDGVAYLWGDGTSGQIGDGNVSQKFLPVPLAAPKISSLHFSDADAEMSDAESNNPIQQHDASGTPFRFLQLACGGHHTLGLVSNDPSAAVYSARQVYRSRIPKCLVDDMIQPMSGISRFGSAPVLLHTFVRPNLKPLARGKVKCCAMDAAYLAFIRLFGDDAKVALRYAAARVRHDAQIAFGLVEKTVSDIREDKKEDEKAHFGNRTSESEWITPKSRFTNDENLFQSSVANCYECGYIFLLAMLNPIYIDHLPDLAEMVVLLLRCEENAREAFLEMLSYCPKDLLVTRLIRPLQFLLSADLKGYGRVRRNATLATKALALCYHGVWRASRRRKVRGLIVPRKEFYNSTVSELMDLREDYDRWMQSQSNRRLGQRLPELPPLPKSGHGESLFSFCTYSFLLSEAAKFQILEMESRHIMTQESMRSVLSFGSLPMPLGMLGQVSHMRVPAEHIAHLQFLMLHVRREHIVSDAFLQVAEMAQRHPRELRKPLRVKFNGEDGVDEGGVRKEFYQVLLEQILSPDYGMFEYHEETRFHWFRKEFLEPEHSWTLIGIMFGLAAFNSILLDVQFPSVVYRKLQVAIRNHMAGRENENNNRVDDGNVEDSNCNLVHEIYKGDLADVKETFPSIGRSLEHLVGYEGGDVEDVFGLTFEVSYEGLFGKMHLVQLVPNGSERPVTSSNRMEFVKLYTDFLINKSIESGFDSFAVGFAFMLNGAFVEMFGADELETLLVGERELDFMELKKSAKYEGYTENSKVIEHFWQVLSEFDEAMKRLFLSFVTGTDRAPIGGLGKLVVVVQRAEGDSNRLPTSHTCFNVLLLPEYGTRAKLRDRLCTAIQNSKGFGLR